MLEGLKLKLNALAGRYGDAATPVCCGVCKPCVTTAAAGVVTGAAAVVVQKVGARGNESERPG